MVNFDPQQTALQELYVIDSEESDESCLSPVSLGVSDDDISNSKENAEEADSLPYLKRLINNETVFLK